MAPRESAKTRPRGGSARRRGTGGPANVSGKVASLLADLLEALHNYLWLKDDDAFVIVLGAVAAFILGLDPVWLLIVAPPSGAKTDFVHMLDEVPEIYPLSDLTPKTLASGFGTPNTADVSLLHEVDGKILALKDLTTVLQKRRDQRDEVLAELREVFDGRFAKAWGTGQRLDWRGRVGFIAGVTSVIDQLHSVMGILGQRFVLLRPRQPDRQAAARRAIQNTQQIAHDMRSRVETPSADRVADPACVAGGDRDPAHQGNGGRRSPVHGPGESGVFARRAPHARVNRSPIYETLASRDVQIP